VEVAAPAGRASVVVEGGSESEAEGIAASDGVGAEVGAGVGVDGEEVVVGRSMTFEEERRVRLRTERLNDVKKKRTAVPIVILLKNVAAPRLPKTVWLDPPKAAPMSAPLPD
jgi:hypothetical protein